jgi:hypothetical protein
MTDVASIERMRAIMVSGTARSTNVIWLSVPPLNSIAKKRGDVRSAAEEPLRACFVFRLTGPLHGARIEITRR